jgi:large subunit ribosomal protein L24
MKIRKNDKVIVLRGKDKGKTGLVLRTFSKKNEVLVEGVNQFKKHKKGEAKGRGELITITKPIDVSKVMLLDPETNKPTKVGYVIEGNIKYRVAKKSGIKLINKVDEPKSEEAEDIKKVKTVKKTKKVKSEDK